ncbi:uncharacterized protein MELLADRAFT_114028 [Melampsora larici-populina 98AG31]|uniref:Secreted protein n=1 Tax=Melampsora larici-populina (strain 98AG31 / pathotype 3-4-7) TaxID=747676 RepID=F4SBX1_MELLP|nr:uncharacterized protein MELLADRAFT_114028 [Melampsora larici-populina 98AG31]EGF97857.1 hypothetical protein MELLADRAFT_114028 [Melampsora larici-populina 98AG31]
MRFGTSISFVLLAIFATVYCEQLQGGQKHGTYAGRSITDQEPLPSSSRLRYRRSMYPASLQARQFPTMGGGQGSGFGGGGFDLKSMFEGFMKMITGGAGGGGAGGGAPPAPPATGGDTTSTPPAASDTPPAGDDSPPPAADAGSSDSS